MLAFVLALFLLLILFTKLTSWTAKRRIWRRPQMAPVSIGTRFITISTWTRNGQDETSRARSGRRFTTGTWISKLCNYMACYRLANSYSLIIHTGTLIETIRSWNEIILIAPFAAIYEFGTFVIFVLIVPSRNVQDSRARTHGQEAGIWASCNWGKMQWQFEMSRSVSYPLDSTWWLRAEIQYGTNNRPDSWCLLDKPLACLLASKPALLQRKHCQMLK